MSLRDEILEQPDAARRVLTAEADARRLGANLRHRRPPFVVIAARGSSDHAALYAQYLFGIRNRMPVALATPSALTLYGARPRFGGALVLGISQSGRSPDIVAVVEEARRQGSPTIAITNDPASPLAAAAGDVLDLHAGPEVAIAATKTYTGELLTVALLSCAIDEPSADEQRDLRGVPGRLEQALAVEATARRAAARQKEMTNCIVLGRGYQYATAREWALKLQEIAQVTAVPFSAADFEHGPMALAEPGLHVLAVASQGPPHDAQLVLLRRLRNRLGAGLLVISDEPSGLRRSEVLPLPNGIPGWLAPIVAIVPGQLHAYHLARAKGLDTERLRSLHKVTTTR